MTRKMNIADSVLQTDTTPRRFLTMAALREAHGNLLQNHRVLGDTPEFLAQTQEFRRDGKILGELLDSSEDRWAAQALLDYWATVLIRANYDAPDMRLSEFDIDKAQYLDDDKCPYRGLEAFEEKDHARFFGRQRFTDELVKKLEESQLVCVVGSSGSGKSSLVRAGLLPRLKQGGLEGSQNWKYYDPIIPSSDPLESLVSALHPPEFDRERWIKSQVSSLQKNENALSELISELGLDVPSVFVIDQFEEIFTLCSDDAARKSFVNNLLGLLREEGPRHVVILTMRTDFVDRLLQLPSLQPIFDKSNVMLMPLLPEELRDAIEEPARLIDLKYQDGVIANLIRDVQEDGTPLPLLQFTLIKLWEKRDHNRITLKAYEELGHAHVALQRTAEKLYQSLPIEEQSAARDILVKLGRLPERGEEVTRNRLPLAALFENGLGRDRIERTLDKFERAHLIRRTKGETDQDTLVEITHEALLRNWKDLVGWLKEKQDYIRRRDRLKHEAEDWDASGRDETLLWKGQKLVDADDFKDLSPLEERFVQESKAAIEADQEREIKRRLELEKAQYEAEFEHKNAKRLQELVEQREAALNEAERERTEAERQRMRAEKQARLAFSRELAAAATNNLTVDPELSILLSIYAAFITYSVGERVAPEAEQALHRSLQDSRVIVSLFGHTDQVRSVAFSPDGGHLATASSDHTVKIWDSYSGKELHTLPGHADGVLDVVFSPDGKLLATASRDKTARVWERNSGEVIRVFKHTEQVLGVAFSPDGKFLATASEDKTAKIWDVATGKKIHSLDEHTAGINTVTFSLDGSHLATASKDRTVKIWNMKTGDWVDKLLDDALDHEVAHDHEVIDVAFSPDGEYIVTAAYDDTIKIWSNPSSDREWLKTLIGHRSWVESIAFSRDGELVATGSQDRTAKVWDFSKFNAGRELFTLAGHTNRIYKVAFSPNGTRLATASRDGTAKVWNISFSREVLTFLGHEEGITSARFSPDGALLATTSYDRTAKIWDATSGQIRFVLEDHSELVTKVAFSPDGSFLVTAGRDGKLVVWDTESGKFMDRLPNQGGCIFDVAFSQDGNLLATAAIDGSAKVWNSKSNTLVYELKHRKPVHGVAFSPPNGRYIVTVSADGIAKVWDGSLGQEYQTHHIHINGITSVAFSPDGSHLITGSYDRTAKIWDPSNGHVSHTLSGHRESVSDVAFSPDGMHVATASDDRTVKVWAVESGQEVFTLPGHADRVSSVAFSPDGRHLASAGHEGTIRVYALPVDDLLMLAEQRATRSLRPAECQKYFRQEECPPVLSAVGGGSRATALWLVVYGKNLARGGDIIGAVASFQKAKDLDPRVVDFDPDVEAKRIANYI